jgi:protease IV
MRRLAVVFAILVAVAVLAAVAGILLGSAGRPLGGGGRTVLAWRLAGPVVERAPAERLPIPGYDPPSSVAGVYRAFRQARADDNVRGVALYIEETRFGLAKAQEFRRQLQALRAAGKFARCYLETAGEGTNGTLAYYLATACDRITLAPTGEVNLLGIYADSLFLRGALDKLKIEPNFNAVGRHKSAGELFTNYEHSPAAEEAIIAVLDSEFEQLVAGIAEARQLQPDVVRRLIDEAPLDAEQAIAAKLVDELAYPDEFRDGLEEPAGGEPRLVPIEDYGRRSGSGGRRIAVVFAQGTILRGDGGIQPWTDEVFLGSNDLGEVLDGLADDDSVAAVVLRVDSPGGSALASDLILRQVDRVQARKPVVASFSDVAASGGYYIAARAKKIVAEAGSITGSIGVVGGKLVTRRFQQELLGVSHDTLQRGRNAGLYSDLESFSPEQQATVERLMRRVYASFLGHVAAGRGMTTAAVDAVAGGRVWTGADAHRLGLVDELGGLDRAVELAREAAGIPEEARVRLVYYPEPPGILELLFRRRRPTIGLDLATLLRAAAPRPRLMLELAPELQRLSRPF